ncbi:hypothetical protein [Acinetobacter sp. WCHA39]|jgi:hypothetical protein|uniref:hypothetical protein n=1 Tax=Acinetobacter sp. WCHA39 TaxID=2004648 RepID=UPI000B3C201C|nr:hypothetical protein [Acinetobacter sp. WCHA39]
MCPLCGRSKGGLVCGYCGWVQSCNEFIWLPQVVNPNDIIEALTGDIDQSLCDDEVCHESV